MIDLLPQDHVRVVDGSQYAADANHANGVNASICAVVRLVNESLAARSSIDVDGIVLAYVVDKMNEGKIAERLKRAMAPTGLLKRSDTGRLEEA